MAGTFGGPANPLAAQPTLTDIPDADLVSPPPESISTIAFSPVADHLAVGSWGPDVSFFPLVALNLTFRRRCIVILVSDPLFGRFDGGGYHCRFEYTT